MEENPPQRLTPLRKSKILNIFGNFSMLVSGGLGDSWQRAGMAFTFISSNVIGFVFGKNNPEEPSKLSQKIADTLDSPSDSKVGYVAKQAAKPFLPHIYPIEWEAIPGITGGGLYAWDGINRGNLIQAATGGAIAVTSSIPVFVKERHIAAMKEGLVSAINSDVAQNIENITTGIMNYMIHGTSLTPVPGAIRGPLTYLVNQISDNPQTLSVALRFPFTVSMPLDGGIETVQAMNAGDALEDIGAGLSKAGAGGLYTASSLTRWQERVGEYGDKAAQPESLGR